MLGLSRTGTLSIRQALMQLGYSAVYHGIQFSNEDVHGAALWHDAVRRKFEGGPHLTVEDWDRLLGRCMVRHVSHSVKGSIESTNLFRLHLICPSISSPQS